MVENDFVQISIALLFNFPVPETTPKKNPRALEIMKLILLVVILSFVGAFTQDRKIADDLMRTNRCYPECLKRLDECIEHFKCSLQRWRCFDYCTDVYDSCMECRS